MEETVNFEIQVSKKESLKSYIGNAAQGEEPILK
jgi:hypothetical protein